MIWPLNSRKLSLAGITLVAAFACLSCESGEKKDLNAQTGKRDRKLPADIVGTVPSPIAASNNEFGFKLAREAVKLEQLNKKPKNIMVSPISAHIALSMALNGTAGTTQNQFLTILGYSGTSVQNINSLYQDEFKRMIIPPPTPEQLEAQSKVEAYQRPIPHVFTLINSAWATNGATNGVKYNFLPAFTNTLKSSYGVETVHSLDFKNEASAGVINKWTSDATNKMIPEIIDGATLSQLVWLLLNTTYLEAKWDGPFSKPSPGTFNYIDQASAQIPMMRRTSRANFFENNDVQVAEIGLLDTTMVAYVVLPKDASQFYSLQTRSDGIWTTRYWSQIFDGLGKTFGTLYMPKFAFDDGITLKKNMDITKDLGLNFLFQPGANFSNMDGAGSPASQVGIIKQNSKIEWDENGVKAAAATLVGGVARSVMPRPTIQMKVDRPFYFAIYDQDTKRFLFIGQVIDPK